MDKAQVNEISKNLVKATANSAPPSTIIAILNDLKNNLKATEELLRSTKIGVTVNKSRQHNDPAVARLASEIVKKWREEVQKQKSATASPNGAAAGKGISAGEKTSRTASPVPKENGAKADSSPKVPLDKRTYQTDKVDVNKTNQSTRDNCIGLIYNGLAFQSPHSSSDILSKATAIEAAGFSTVGPETNPGYSTKMRSLFMNLKNKSNPGLRARVLSGEISPERFVTMTADELKSKERKVEDEKLMKENMKEAQMPQVERSISSSLECKNPKCGKLTVAYTQAQTRRLASRPLKPITHQRGQYVCLHVLPTVLMNL